MVQGWPHVSATKINDPQPKVGERGSSDGGEITCTTNITADFRNCAKKQRVNPPSITVTGRKPWNCKTDQIATYQNLNAGI